MKPSEACRAAGLSGLNELAALTRKTPQTIINWYKYQPLFFRIVLAGAVATKPTEVNDGCAH
jgi:hypothetical protein